MRALLCAGTLALATTGAPAHAAEPTFTATTTVGSHRLPESVARGTWTVGPGGTTATLHMEMTNPSTAVTRVAAGWVSSYVRPYERCFGQYSFRYWNHRIVLPTPHITHWMRYREQGGRWSGWRIYLDEDYEDTEPDMAVGRRYTDDCLVLFPRMPRRPVQFEIQLRGEYAGTHRIREDLTVALP